MESKRCFTTLRVNFLFVQCICMLRGNYLINEIILLSSFSSWIVLFNTCLKNVDTAFRIWYLCDPIQSFETMVHAGIALILTIYFEIRKPWMFNITPGLSHIIYKSIAFDVIYTMSSCVPAISTVDQLFQCTWFLCRNNKYLHLFALIYFMKNWNDHQQIWMNTCIWMGVCHKHSL